MKNIILFGYGFKGAQIFRKLEQEYADKYNLIGFCDNCAAKQGNYTFGHKILSFADLISLNKKIDFSVIITSSAWPQIGKELDEHKIPIEAVYERGDLQAYEAIYFKDLNFSKPIKFYAGDICDNIHMNDPDLYGLSIQIADKKHIFHNITTPYPLPDNCIDSYQAEDVLEHLEFHKVVSTINEIYRILKPGSLFRMSLPDYRSNYLKRCSMTDAFGSVIYDPNGGSSYNENGIEIGGHMWFPTYEIVSNILAQSRFKTIDFRCFYDSKNKPVINPIDHNKGYVQRVPENNKDTTELYTMVVDCYK